MLFEFVIDEFRLKLNMLVKEGKLLLFFLKDYDIICWK